MTSYGFETAVVLARPGLAGGPRMALEVPAGEIEMTALLRPWEPSASGRGGRRWPGRGLGR